MSEIKYISAGFVMELNKRVKVSDHKLWGSQCLLTHANEIVDTQREFLRFGVDILITNTYQASVEGFMQYLSLSEEEAIELIKSSVENCKKAIELEKKDGTIDPAKEIQIAGSVGSFGACLADGSEYNGSYLEKYTSDEIKSWHRKRIQALVEGGVDYLAFETIPSIKEAEILIKLLAEYPNMKGWISFSAKDSTYTGHGERFVDAIPYIWSLNYSNQLVAVGVNCTAAKNVHEIVNSIINNDLKSKVPLVVYPNCGKIWDAQKKEWICSNNEECYYDNLIYQWCSIGVKYIGLCCDTPIESRYRTRKVIDKYLDEKKKNIIGDCCCTANK